VAELVRGSARGRFSVTFGPKATWQTEAKLYAVDRRRSIAGCVRCGSTGISRRIRKANDTLVLADLRNQGDISATLNVDLRVSSERLAVNAATLVLGQGNIDVVGEMALTGTAPGSSER